MASKLLRAIGEFLLADARPWGRRDAAAELQHALFEDRNSDWTGVVAGPYVTVLPAEHGLVKLRVKTVIGKTEFNSETRSVSHVGTTEKAIEIALEDHARYVAKQLVARFHETAQVA